MVLKTPEIAREMLQELQKFVQERWRRVFQRATVTGGAWAHAPPQRETKTSGSSTSSSSLSVVTPTITCTGSKNTQSQRKSVGFNFFLFRICS